MKKMIVKSIHNLIGVASFASFMASYGVIGGMEVGNIGLLEGALWWSLATVAGALFALIFIAYYRRPEVKKHEITR